MADWKRHRVAARAWAGPGLPLVVLVSLPLLVTAVLASVFVRTSRDYHAAVGAAATDMAGVMLRDVFDVIMSDTHRGTADVVGAVVRELNRIELQEVRPPRPKELLRAATRVIDSLAGCDCPPTVPLRGVYLFESSGAWIETAGNPTAGRWSERLVGRVQPPKGARVSFQSGTGTDEAGPWFTLLLPLPLDIGEWWVFGLDVDPTAFADAVIAPAHLRVAEAYLGSSDAHVHFGLRVDHPGRDGILVVGDPAAGATYSLPIFRNELSLAAVDASEPWVAHASLRPSVIPLVIPGGLPSSPVPMVATALLSALAVTALAVAVLVRHQRLVRMREEFVASVSHELRTPLAQILLYAETLQLDSPTPNAKRDAADIIVREARRLAHLAEGALTFVRNQRPEVGFAPEPTDLRLLIAASAAGFTDLARERAARVSGLGARGAPVVVDADPTLMRRALDNLVENALQHGPDGQRVTIDLATLRGEVLITVEDEGPGIREEDRARIWTAFARPARSPAGGSGLGLALVRQTVELHGGTVSVAPASGGGSRFEVRLPAPGRVT